MALSHPWFLPWPLLAFPVTCNDLTWEGGCSTAGWLQGLFWCAGQVWPFPATDDCSPLSQTPHMGCASGCASVCTRSCSLSLPFLLLCLKAEKHHFSCCLLLGFRQYGTMKVLQDSPVDSCIWRRSPEDFWTTLYLKLPKFSLYKFFCEHFIAMPKLFSMFCADKEKLFQRKHCMPFWMTSCCFPTVFFFAFFFFLLHHILILSLPPLETDGELVVLMSSLLPREGGLKCFVLWELTGWAPSLRM